MQGLYTGVGGKTGFSEDIRASTLREVEEETGLILSQPILKAVVKTVLEGQASSWILFAYLAYAQTELLQPCDEGLLEWTDLLDLASVPLIGFIREILSHVLSSEHVLEATFHHDAQGKITAFSEREAKP